MECLKKKKKKIELHDYSVLKPQFKHMQILLIKTNAQIEVVYKIYNRIFRRTRQFTEKFVKHTIPGMDIIDTLILSV